MKVYLSAGHSGGEVGAVANGTNEETECKRIVEEAIEICQKAGFKTVYKVPTDLKLASRINWINTNIPVGDTLVIDVHMNSASALAKGAEYYFFRGNDYAQRTASNQLKQWCKDTGIASRGIFPDTDTRHGRLGIIADTKPFVLLLEMGFITNTDDLEKVRKKAARALANQAILFLNDRLLSMGEEPRLVPAPTAGDKVIPPEFVESVMKAKQKKIIEYWDNPNEEIELWRILASLHKLGFVKDPTGKLTLARWAKILDNMHHLD